MAKVGKRRGRYVLDFYNNQGNRHRKTLPEGTIKKRAREILRDIEDQLEKGVYIPQKKALTFKRKKRKKKKRDGHEYMHFIFC